MDHVDLKSRRTAPLGTPTNLASDATRDLSRCADHAAGRFFRPVCQDEELPLAHVGPHFRDYHLLLDEQAEQIFAATDTLPSACARSAAPRCAPSARSRASSACSTTTRTMSRL